MRARRGVAAANAMMEMAWLHEAAQDAIARGGDPEACEAQALAATIERARRAEADCEGSAFTELCEHVERAVALFGQDLIAEATGADLRRDFAQRATLSVFNGDALDVVALCWAENDVSRAPVFEAALMREYSLGEASGEMFVLRYLWQKLRMLPRHADSAPSFLARLCGHNPKGVDAQGRVAPERRSVPLPRVIEFLLDARADPNARGTAIDPPLHYLLKSPEWTPAHREALGLLLDRGAHPDAKNAAGLDAFEIAREHGQGLQPAQAEARLHALCDALARRDAPSIVGQITTLIAATDRPAAERATRLHALLGEAEALDAPFVVLSEAIRQHEVGALTALLALDAFDPLATDDQGVDLLMAAPSLFNACAFDRRREAAAQQIVGILAQAIGVERRDVLGRTALMHAADEAGPVFDWILKRPQDVAAQDREGRTALMRLALANDTARIARLIQREPSGETVAQSTTATNANAINAVHAISAAHSADAVNALDAQGQTALRHAIAARALDAAEQLAPATRARLDEALAACVEQASAVFLGQPAPWSKRFALLADALAARCSDHAAREALARLGLDSMPHTARRVDAQEVERGIAEGRAAAAQAADNADTPAVAAVAARSPRRI